MRKENRDIYTISFGIFWFFLKLPKWLCNKHFYSHANLPPHQFQFYSVMSLSHTQQRWANFNLSCTLSRSISPALPVPLLWITYSQWTTFISALYSPLPIATSSNEKWSALSLASTLYAWFPPSMQEQDFISSQTNPSHPPHLLIHSFILHTLDYNPTIFKPAPLSQTLLGEVVIWKHVSKKKKGIDKLSPNTFTKH